MTTDPGYQTLYRRYRPGTFAEVIGQAHVTGTLARSLESGRMAHAYLFAGPRGTGKTTTARILAKALNCESGPTATPCLKCRHCVEAGLGRHIDVLEIDAASNRGIDEIRALRERAGFAPAEARRKVYIVDEVHMLTTEAFNALLKLLEEPPAHVLFVLATTEPHKVPRTVESRCQRFDFRPLGLEDLVRNLREVAEKEGIAAEEEALREIARASAGGARDALAALEQLSAYCGASDGASDLATAQEGASSESNEADRRTASSREHVIEGTDGTATGLSAEKTTTTTTTAITATSAAPTRAITTADVRFLLGKSPIEEVFRGVDALLDGSPAGILLFVEELDRSGRDLRDCAARLAEHLKRVLMAGLEQMAAVDDLPADLHPRLKEQVSRLEPAEALRWMESLARASQGMRDGRQARLGLEVALLTLSGGRGAAGGESSLLAELDGLRARVAGLEAEMSRLKAGGVARSAPEAQPVRVSASAPATRSGAGSPPPAVSRPRSAAAEAEAEAPAIGMKGAPGAAEGAEGERCLDLEAVKKLWPDIVREVRSKRIATYALLLEAQPVAFCDSTLTLRFGPKAAFHRGEMEKEVSQSLLREALRKVLGFSAGVNCVMSEAGIETPSTDGTVEDQALEGDELVAAIKERFSAQVVE